MALEEAIDWFDMSSQQTLIWVCKWLMLSFKGLGFSSRFFWTGLGIFCWCEDISKIEEEEEAAGRLSPVS